MQGTLADVESCATIQSRSPRTNTPAGRITWVGSHSARESIHNLLGGEAGQCVNQKLDSGRTVGHRGWHQAYADKVGDIQIGTVGKHEGGWNV